VRCDVQAAARCQANNVVQGLGLDTIRTHKWTIMACSAMTGTKLQDGLQWVVQDAKSRLFLY
jgi:ADP-ribosylation factor-like protein 2